MVAMPDRSRSVTLKASVFVPPCKVAYLALLRYLDRAGLSDLNGHLLYQIPEDLYTVAEAWLADVGVLGHAYAQHGHQDDADQEQEGQCQHLHRRVAFDEAGDRAGERHHHADGDHDRTNFVRVAQRLEDLGHLAGLRLGDVQVLDERDLAVDVQTPEERNRRVVILVR